MDTHLSNTASYLGVLAPWFTFETTVHRCSARSTSRSGAKVSLSTELRDYLYTNPVSNPLIKSVFGGLSEWF